VHIKSRLEGDIRKEELQKEKKEGKYTDKKLNKMSSYIRKFRMEQLQSHI
jgi:hypothetical protein